MPPRTVPNRIIRRALEFVVGICLLALAFTFVLPGKGGVAYFIAAMVVLLFVLNLLRKWPSV